jgi:hypothetical protein
VSLGLGFCEDGGGSDGRVENEYFFIVLFEKVAEIADVVFEDEAFLVVEFVESE